jgi:hypothetical protein
VAQVKDSKEYAQAIALTPTFRSFAAKANLDADLQRKVSHIVALYYMDEASIAATTVDPNRAAKMRRQLRQHMDVRVRAAIPQESWMAFEESGLLPAVSGARDSHS